MIFFCSGNGDIFHVIPDRVYQGSAGANVIRLVGQFPSSAQVLVAYQLPQGEWTVPKFMTPVAQLEEVQAPNGGKFAVWETLVGASPQISADGKVVKDEDGNTVYDLDYTITQDFGTVNLQFYVYTAARGVSVDGVFTNIGGQLLATASSSFIVEKGVSVVTPEFDTDDSKALLQQILSVLANTQELYENTAQALETVNETLEDHDRRILHNGAAIASTNITVTEQGKQISTNTSDIGVLKQQQTLTQNKVNELVETGKDHSQRLSAAETQIAENAEQIDKNTAAIETLQAATPSYTLPLMDGEASAGTANTFARGDHIHPTDTSRLAAAEKGNPNGVASLDSSGKVPSEQLPSYVDDVIDFNGIITGSNWQAKVLALPVGSLAFVDETTSAFNKKFVRNTNGTAEGLTAVEPMTDVIYVDTTDNATYRWSGTTLASLSSGLKLGETTGTAYDGGKGTTNAQNIAKNAEAIKTNADGISSLKTQVSTLKDNVEGVSTDISNTKTALSELTDKVDEGYVTVVNVISSTADEFQISYSSGLNFTLPLSGGDDLTVDVNEKGDGISVRLSDTISQTIAGTADKATKNAQSINTLSGKVDTNTAGLATANANIAQNTADINSQGSKITAVESKNTEQDGKISSLETQVGDLNTSVNSYSGMVNQHERKIGLLQDYTDGDATILKAVVSDGGTVTFAFTSSEIDTIDWGDGTINQDVSHTYTTAGTYFIKVYGYPYSVTSRRPLPAQIKEVRIARNAPLVNVEVLDTRQRVDVLEIPDSVKTIVGSARDADYKVIIFRAKTPPFTYGPTAVSQLMPSTVLVPHGSVTAYKQQFANLANIITSIAYLSDIEGQSIDLSDYYQTVSSVTAQSVGFKVGYSNGESINLPLVGSDTIVETVNGDTIKYELSTTLQNAINKSLKLPSAIDGVEEIVTLKPQNGSTTPVQSSVKLNTLLSKPATPTEDSAVVITNAGAQTLKPLSDIGSKIYKHKITFTINKKIGNFLYSDGVSTFVEAYIYDGSSVPKQQSWLTGYISTNMLTGYLTVPGTSEVDTYEAFGIGLFRTSSGSNIIITSFGRNIGGSMWQSYAVITDNITNFTDTVTEL